jgi:hypothetical protein
MIFRRIRRQKQASKYLRMRVESCVATILELNKRLGDGMIKPEVIEQFEKLQESIRFVTDESVEEKDINRIEEATNQLLAEIRDHCGDSKICSLYEGPTH